MPHDLKSTLEKLENYSDSPSPVLSVYLEIPDSDVNKRLLRLFQDLVILSLDPQEQEIFAKELDAIEAYVRTFNASSDEKGLAFFVSGNTLWEVIHTKGPAATSLMIKHTPNLTPLLEEENIPLMETT